MSKEKSVTNFGIQIINNGFLVYVGKNTTFCKKLSEAFSIISGIVEEQARFGGVNP